MQLCGLQPTILPRTLSYHRVAAPCPSRLAETVLQLRISGWGSGTRSLLASLCRLTAPQVSCTTCHPNQFLRHAPNP